MEYVRIDSAEYDPFSPSEWEKWRKLRYNCEAFTSYLRAQVPVLEYVNWEVTRIEPGLVHTILPLISATTNQHCTHQAALFFLTGDYTGGIALASMMPEFPVAGVHPSSSSEVSSALWSARGEIKYSRPSMGPLEAVARIDPERHPKIRRRFLQGKPVLETVPILFYNGTAKIAEAAMTYYIRRSDALRSEGGEPEKANQLSQYKRISSAELIAGVRAKENGTLFEDPYSAPIAGEHGRALAERFCEKMPQLGMMVAARTRHLDRQIIDFVGRGGRNLVLLGAGYDMRPFRLNLPAGMNVYELDYPSVLIDRQKRLDALNIKDPPSLRRFSIPTDLRAISAADALRDRLDFSAPLFIVLEGMSMYFREPELRTLLRGILALMRHPASRLWADFATAEAVFHSEVHPEIKKFMQGMQVLGEPFIFGSDAPDDFLESNGFYCSEVVPSSVFLKNSTDPVYEHYRFCVASGERVTVPERETSEVAPLAVHPAHPISAPVAPESVRENVG